MNGRVALPTSCGSQLRSPLRRRLLAGFVAALPLSAVAQMPVPRRVAFLWGPAGPETLQRVRAGLARAGFVDGAALASEVLAPALDGNDAAAVVGTALRNGAELIVAQGPLVPPLHRAVAQRVPMVVAFSGDLVAAGLADSLRTPGRRTTGVSFLVLELVGKRLELLTEVAPKAQRVGVLLNSRHYGYQAELAETERAARALKLATATFDVRSPQDFVGAFEAMALAKLDGVVVFPDATMTRMAPDIAAFGLRERLPVISGWAAITEAGALASYGPDLGEAYERVGAQAARNLRGADASAMPIELPTRIRTVLNLKTARSLGVALSPSLTARAEIV
jgi:putative ABC transport system substrate-binding protein